MLGEAMELGARRLRSESQLGHWLVFCLFGPQSPVLYSEELDEIAQKPVPCSEVLGP